MKAEFADKTKPTIGHEYVTNVGISYNKLGLKTCKVKSEKRGNYELRTIFSQYDWKKPTTVLGWDRNEVSQISNEIEKPDPNLFIGAVKYGYNEEIINENIIIYI